MRLATGTVPSPILRRQAVFVGDDDGNWKPLGETLAQAGIVASASVAQDLPEAISLLSSMRRSALNKIDAALSKSGDTPDAAPDFDRPVADRAKVMVVGGWQPVSRPDLELDHVTPHVMARWMDAKDFRRPPITVFKKFPSAIADPGSEISLPQIKLVQGAPSDGPFEADATLAVIIGKPALRVTVRGALRHVFGLSLMLDVWNSEIFREEARVRRGMLSKNLSNLTPLGPWIQILDGPSIDDDMEVELKIDGNVRQRFRVGDFAYRIAEVISFCSSVGLEPGDVIAFGARIARGNGPGPLETPATIAPGDRIEIAAPAMGTLKANVTSAAHA